VIWCDFNDLLWFLVDVSDFDDPGYVTDFADFHTVVI